MASLGAFAAVPDKEALSSIMAKVQAITKLPITTSASTAPSTTTSPPAPAPVSSYREAPVSYQGQEDYQQQQPQQQQPVSPSANSNEVANSGNNSYASDPPSTVRACKVDPMFLSNVEGMVTSVSNKIVLVQFFNGVQWRLAKFSPGMNTGNLYFEHQFVVLDYRRSSDPLSCIHVVCLLSCSGTVSFLAKIGIVLGGGKWQSF